MLTIKNIIISALIVLALIWGVILYLAFSDPSYQLFIPHLPFITGEETVDNSETGIDTNQEGPWNKDLVLALGNDPLSFSESKVLVQGSATPSAALRNNELMVYFNYFPEGERRIFGTIHQIKSSDNGQTWTKPVQVMIFNSPSLSVIPFSPKIVILPNNKIKLFYLAKKKDEDRIKLFAAISEDGEKFAYDPATSFEIENQSLNSFALTILNNRMHLLAYTVEGSQTSTAYHAVSYDTSVFTRLTDVVIKDSYYGQNTLISDGSGLKLYGTSDKGLWNSTSKDGNSWSPISYLSFNAENPGIVRNQENYYLFYNTDSVD